MLVLSRKVGERIVIGGDITVTVVRIVGNNVRIGIEAPGEMPIIRHELLTGDSDDQDDPLSFDSPASSDPV